MLADVREIAFFNTNFVEEELLKFFKHKTTLSKCDCSEPVFNKNVIYVITADFMQLNTPAEDDGTVDVLKVKYLKKLNSRECH